MLSFVILHYKNVDDTVECLNSIKKLDNQEKISIIIVDNKSLSDEEKKILEEYTDDIILLDSNMGYAKANNIGCKYAIEKYNPDFIYVINNDTIVNQNDLLCRIKRLYDKYKFDCCGPKIITNFGDSVNPFPAYENIKQIKKVIAKNKLLLFIYNSKILNYILEKYLFIKYKFVKIKHLENANEDLINVALHGCAIIFSKKYLLKYKDPFYNETFLYHEEEFLVYRKNKDSLIFIYTPELEIFHKEGASLNFDKKDNRLKNLFRCKESTKSLEMLLDVMEDGGRI